MNPYKENLTLDEVKSCFDDYFINGQQGRIVKIVWFMKNKPDYTKNIIQQVFGNIQDYDDIYEFIYNAYHPNCIKVCPICKKPLDGFTIQKGYYQSFKHKMCKKPYFYEKFSSYTDLVGRIDFRTGAAIKTIAKRLDVVPLLEQFRSDHPLFSHYTNFDSAYICIMFDTLINVEDHIPRCFCGKLVKIEPMKHGYETVQFSRSCYDNICKNKQMVSTLSNTYLKNTGYSNPSQNPNVKKKKEESFLKHYGSWTEMMNATLWGWCNRMGIQNTSQLQSVKDKNFKLF